MPNTSTIFIGSDHAGFSYKEKLKLILNEKKLTYQDMGNTENDPDDDYPDFAALVAKKVRENSNHRGILVCGTGIGMCIAANRYKGIRAVNAVTAKQAQMARRHNNANILCLGESTVPFWIAKKVLTAWLTTKFDIAVRHRRRVSKLDREVEGEV